MRNAVAAALAALLALGVVALRPDAASAVAVQQTLIATSTGPGGGPHVKLFTADGQERASFFAYDAGFTGGLSVALGDINNDGRLEIITGAGPGGGPHVRVFNDRGVPIDKWAFFAYDPAFHGGVNVSVSDVNGDGRDEIVTAPMGGGGPHVKVWNVGTDATTMRSQFFAYDATFTGGVQLSGAYVDNSNNEGIVTGAGPGGGPHVKTWSATNQQVGSWFAYAANYTGGVGVTYFSDDDDDIDEIATSALSGNGQIRSFDVSGQPASVSFDAFDQSVHTGAAIASVVAEDNGPFLVAPFGAGPGVCANNSAPPNCTRGDYVHMRDFDGAPTLQLLPYPGFQGGIRVAGAFGLYDPSPPPTTTTTTPTSTTSTSTTSTTVPPTTTTSTSTTMPPTTTTSTSTTSTTAP
jgi:hypothetical protein